MKPKPLLAVLLAALACAVGASSASALPTPTLTVSGHTWHWSALPGAEIYVFQFKPSSPWWGRFGSSVSPEYTALPGEACIRVSGLSFVQNLSYGWSPYVCQGTAHWTPPKTLTWYWQLNGALAAMSGSGAPARAAAWDVDGESTSAAQVAALHSAGHKAICYVDVGTWEPWRADAGSFPAAVKGSSVEGFAEEKWLDIRALSTLQPIMVKRFQSCKEKGFDAVEPDNMDGYSNASGFPLTAAQQLTYNEWVAGEVHSLGLAVFQKNDGEQVGELKSHFDGVISEQCNQYSECPSFQPYLAEGKPVLNAEYSLATSSFCPPDNAAGIMGARFNVALDGRVYEPC